MKVSKFKRECIQGNLKNEASKIYGGNESIYNRNILSFYEERGITLIALVITIIILLILAGVGISMGLNGGLLGKAKDVVDVHNREAQKEQEMLEQYLDMIDKETKLAGVASNSPAKKTIYDVTVTIETNKPINTPDGWTFINNQTFTKIYSTNETENVTIIDSENNTGTVNIDVNNIVTNLDLINLVNEEIIGAGDYIEYTPTGSSYIVDKTYSGNSSNETINKDVTLNWRVLDVQGTQVRLISDKATSNTVTLVGEEGYNNLVKILDDLCSTIYASTGKGTARSIKIEDIEEKMTETALSSAHVAPYNTIPYPKYTLYKSYPKIWENENGRIIDDVSGGTLGLSKQDIWYTGTKTAATSISAKHTRWTKNMIKTDFTKDIYYTLYINNGSSYSSYWLASRSVHTAEEDVGFCGCWVNDDDYVTGNVLTSAAGCTEPIQQGHAFTFSVRPIITLNTGSQVNNSDIAKDGLTPEKAWILE